MDAAGLAFEDLITSLPQQSSIALGAWMKCRQIGMKVSQDISILGFHDVEFAACASPSLLSVATRRHELGRLATETCLNAIAGKVAVTVGQIDLGYKTIARESTSKNS